MKYKEGFAIDEYQGEYFMVRAQVGKDGKLYARWMRPMLGKDKVSEKSIPWKISLGNKQQAIQRLEQLIMHIEGRTTPGELPPDDIPF